MKSEKLLYAIGKIDDSLISGAERAVAASKHGWLKWAAVAACLCAVLGISVICFAPGSQTPADNGATEDGAPHVEINGRTYLVSSYAVASQTCPDGFVYGGMVPGGELEGYSYYVNAEVPEWVYVYEEAGSQAQKKYVRYVDERIRGKDFVCRGGQLYISMWSASYYGAYPDITRTLYEEIADTYGIRIEGEAPSGFVSAGTAEFSGLDTVPCGELGCNTGSVEVFVNSEDGRIVLVPTKWYTAIQGNGEDAHTGYNVYVLYGGTIE